MILSRFEPSLSPSPLQNLLPFIVAATARAVSFSGRFDPFAKQSVYDRCLREETSRIDVGRLRGSRWWKAVIRAERLQRCGVRWAPLVAGAKENSRLYRRGNMIETTRATVEALFDHEAKKVFARAKPGETRTGASTLNRGREIANNADRRGHEPDRDAPMGRRK